MMRRVVFIFALLIQAARAASPSEMPVEDQIKIAERIWESDGRSNERQELENISSLLEGYAEKNQGNFPKACEDLERQFGPRAGMTGEEWITLRRSIVFLPYIEGDFIDSVEGSFRAKMVFVLISPIEQKRKIKHPYGRWVLWKSLSGKFFTRWHDEEDIQKFSAWPQVQSVIREEIVRQSKVPTQNASNAVQSSSSGNAIPLPASQPTTTAMSETIKTSKDALSSSPDWFLILSSAAAVILAGAVAFRFLKK